jgi:4-hydroxy-2-oxoheptanedioate aldolase
MVHEIAFMSEGRTIPIVRLVAWPSNGRTTNSLSSRSSVPGHDRASIGFALNAGASIVIPQVDTVEQAKHVVSASKYGTKHRGTRSGPPFRLLPGISDIPIDPTWTIYENLNDQAAVIIQVENLPGNNNLDAILTEVPDIDAVWPGTMDCRVSMGLAGFFGDEPEWLDALCTYQKALEKHDMPDFCHVLGRPREMQAAGGQGKACVVVSGDVPALMVHIEELETARKTFGPLTWRGKHA